MRLHRLDITAFGPFVETARIDFDALGADGLFLLHGHTGAGKTSVLDAVAFALYGTVPGARRDCKRLHSDHAPAGVVPTVVLEATIAGRRLRITRSPEFARPKRNGSGTRVVNARATLAWLDGRGQNLTRINEIGDEVNRLLGMSADQFFQVVLLPQGEFARFLRADNDDRERLLERLFDTERFGTAEQWLAYRRRESAAKLDDARQAIDRLAAQVATAAGVPVAPTEPMDWARNVLAEARDAKQSSTAALNDIRSAAESAAHRHAEGRRVVALRERLAVAEADLADHRSHAAYRAELARELDAARRAAPVGTAIADADESAEDAQLAAERADAAWRTLEQIPGSADLLTALHEHTTADPRELVDGAIREWTTETARLDTVIAEARHIEAITADLAALRAEDAELDSAAAEAAVRRSELPAQRATIEVQLRSRVELAARRDAIAAECDSLTAALTATTDFAEHRAALDRAGHEHADLREQHLAARERLIDVRELRLAGMAAELAAQLVDGEACAVCGSTDHPEPARATPNSVGLSDEKRAAAAEQHAAAAVARAAETMAEIRRLLDSAAARGGDRDPAELRALSSEATERSTAAAQAAVEAERLTVVLRGLAEEDERLVEQLRAQHARRSSIAERLVAGEAEVDRIRGRVVEAAGSDATAAHRRDRLHTLVRSAIAVRDARADVESRTAHAVRLAARADDLLLERGFADRPTAAAAVRGEARLRAIESELAAADEVRVRAEAVLADTEVRQAGDIEPPDLPALAEAANETAGQRDNAIAVHAEAVRRAAQLEDLVVQLWSAIDHLAPMTARHDELAGIADLVAGRGQNARRMSLRSYVLAARLEEVAVAASARLDRMSAGRYEFVHSDASGPRGKRGGLGLEVRDDYTGAVRPAKTLSGGETFLASLALALGLADVVAAESGGLALDTIFIDEGFGSLDADTLDSVMGVLDELRAGGRVVGIVSHVEEMRLRIPNRLHVIRDRAGSRVQVQAMGPAA